MRAGSKAEEDPGQYTVWLGDIPWLVGLVKREDAERLATQANRAAEQMGKAGRYSVRGPQQEEQTA